MVEALDSRIDPEHLPRHIAVIMDGNGRWAKKHGIQRIEGHEAGAASVRRVTEACRELGVPALTLYAFSTENWRRSKMEVSGLFRLMSKYIRQEIDALDKNNVRVRFMGRMERLPKNAADDLVYCMERTKGNTALSLNVAVNYGGRAARRIAEQAAKGELDPASLSEEEFARHLYLPEYAEVDLLIRTSGELRISNFMLWQLSYAEIVAPSVLWPDFSKQDLCDAILNYQCRSRRFGGRP